MGQLITTVPRRHLSELGKVTVAFQALEHHLATLTQIALTEDLTAGRIVTSKLSFRHLLDCLGALLHRHLADGRQKVNVRSFLTRASKAEEERNRLVHSFWVGGADARHRPLRVRTVAKRNDGLCFDTEEVTLSRLTALVTELQSIAFDAIDIEVALRKALGRQ